MELTNESGNLVREVIREEMIKKVGRAKAASSGGKRALIHPVMDESRGGWVLRRVAVRRAGGVR